MASIQLQGDNSGSLTIQAPSDAGNHTLTLPATTHTLATQNALGVRNLIINGDMRIAQRATSATGITSSGYYTVDRFQFFEATDGTYTMTQDTDVPTGQGFSNSLKINTTTADTSITGTQSLRLRHGIEGQNLQHLKFGTSNAESITLSFWIKSNLTGDFVSRLLNNSSNRHITSVVTINAANTWEKKTITYAGDTTGTFANDNTGALFLDIFFAGGPDITSGAQPTTWQSNSTANQATGTTIDLASSTSNYVNITGVQLEVGDTATPFEHRPYDMEALRCYRYYWNGDGSHYSSAYSNGAFLIIDLPTHMRARPTVSYGSTNATGTFTDYSRTNRFQLYDNTDPTYNVVAPTADAEL